MYSITNEHIAFFFFFNDTATTEIYTLSLHDALPIYQRARFYVLRFTFYVPRFTLHSYAISTYSPGMSLSWSRRSEEHTSELQSLAYLVCRLLLEKKKKTVVHR